MFNRELEEMSGPDPKIYRQNSKAMLMNGREENKPTPQQNSSVPCSLRNEKE